MEMLLDRRPFRELVGGAPAVLINGARDRGVGPFGRVGEFKSSVDEAGSGGEEDRVVSISERSSDISSMPEEVREDSESL
jgi:hypothetical protein